MMVPHFRITSIILSIGLSLSLALHGCGGDLNPGGGGTGVRPAISIGPISGFGSVIVNGVRYDDSAASVSDESGAPLPVDALRLGMTVELRGTADPGAMTGNASSILVFSELKGFVDALSADSLTVAGVTVQRLSSTIYDGGNNLVLGDYVEVYGAFDAVSNSVTASRIERESPSDFKVPGLVSDWTPAANTFMLASLTIDYSGTTLPAGFDNGSSVRVVSNQAPASGPWPVSQIRAINGNLGDDGDYAEIEGVVQSVQSATQFTISGIAIDASNAQFEGGSGADVQIGRRLEVEGQLQGGSLVASEVEFEDGPDDEDSFELTGRISNLNGDQFMLRGVAVDASQSPSYEDGTAADLANGVCVEVEGQIVSSSQGSELQASEISFEDECE